MMLKFEPQTAEQMRARFADALGVLYDYRAGYPAVTPANKREHVFDYADGLRLMVSRDIEDDAGPFIHLSASAVPDSQLYLAIAQGRITPRNFKSLVQGRYQRLSGQSFDPEFCGFSTTKLVPHWRKREEGH